MNIIAAVDRNWGIGLQGRLLVTIPSDQKWFQQMTKGKVIVAGRKTLLTFPNGLPLPARENIILTSDRGFQIKGARIARSMEEALYMLSGYREEDIFIAGGESIYRQFLPYCKVAHITSIDYEYQADAYFPNLDKLPEWKLTEDSDEQTYFDLEYTFRKYERTAR